MSFVKSLKNLMKPTMEKESAGTSTNLSTLFYSVYNHDALYRIGKSFVEDVQKGVTSFAISSLGYPTSQQHCIMGLASYFDIHASKKVTIISSQLEDGVFKELVLTSFKEDSDSSIVSGVEVGHYNFYDKFDFIELNDIIQIAKKKPAKYESYLDILFTSDVVFLDLPDLNTIKEDLRHYQALLKRVESLSIVIVRNLSSEKELEKVHNFFMNFGMNLKGLILEPEDGFQKKMKESRFA